MMRQGMKEEGDILPLPAKLDSATSAAVGDMLLSAIRPGARLIVDGSAVEYMSAAGVRVLATALHRAQEVDARMVLCSFAGAAADCLMVSGFAQMFDVAASLEEARGRLAADGPRTTAQRLHARGTAG